MLKTEPPGKNSLILPRWVLYASYFVIVLQGVALMLTDSFAVPKLGIVDYLVLYGSGMTVTGLLSMYSAMRRWAVIECVSTFLLFSGLTMFVGFTFLDWIDDTADRGAVSIIGVLVLLFLLGRFAVLFTGLTRLKAVKRRIQ